MEILSETMIDKIESGYNKILRLYQSIPVTNLLEPVFANGWSVKDMLAHIAAWEWRCAGILNAAQDSNMPFHGSPDVNALNEEFYKERAEWSWEEVDNDFREAHRTLLLAIRSLSTERLHDELVQKSIAEETWEHYEQHLPSLENWHKQMVTNYHRH
jgi:hypothetical protein